VMCLQSHSAPLGITRLRSAATLLAASRVASYHAGLSVFLNDRIPVCWRDALILNTAKMLFIDLCSCVFGFARNWKTVEEANQKPLT